MILCVLMRFSHISVVRVTQNLALQVTLPDAGAGLEDIKILQNVGESHQPQRSQKSQTNPGPEQNNER